MTFQLFLYLIVSALKDNDLFRVICPEEVVDAEATEVLENFWHADQKSAWLSALLKIYSLEIIWRCFRRYTSHLFPEQYLLGHLFVAGQSMRKCKPR